MTELARYGVVVLTQGKRPELLASGLRSVLTQRDVVVDVLVVGNGWQPSGLPAGVRALALPENVGIPAGRNAGVPEVAGDLLLFEISLRGEGFAHGQSSKSLHQCLTMSLMLVILLSIV